jgi:predicted extracellular nuclease
MKKNLLWLIIPAILLIAWMPVHAQQRLPNGGFETWTAGPGGPPDGWVYGSTGINAVQEAARVNSGTYAAKLLWDGNTGTKYFNTEPLPVIGGETYACSLYVYDNDTTGTTSKARVRPWYYFNVSGGSGPSTYSTDGESYQLYTWSQVAPATATSLTLQIRAYGGITGSTDSVWVDDVVLWGPVPVENLPPSITNVYRYPYPDINDTDVVTVSANITDADGTIVSDSLYFQINGGGYSPVGHDSTSSGDADTYWFTIGANAEGTVVDYYVVATDDQAGRSESSVYSYTVTAPVTNVQLLQNNGFETWTNGPSSPPDNWINVDADSISATQEASIVYDGSYSTNLTWIAPTQAYCEFRSDPVAVQEGAVYACSTWVYDNDASGRITTYLKFNNYNYYPNTYSVDGADWQHMGYTYTAPAGATTVQVIIRAYDVSGWDGDATVYVDDVSLWGPEVSGNIPPSVSSVYSHPYPIVYPTDIATISAIISDVDGTIADDSAYFQVNSGVWNAVYHDSIDTGNPDMYWFTVGTNPGGSVVNYNAMAIDNEGARTQSNTYSYTVTPEVVPTVPIYALQHTDNVGTLPNCYPTDSLGNVETINGIVMGVYANNVRRCFVQDAVDPWSAVYVYNIPIGQTAILGDNVTITGTITEYNGETELGTISSYTIESSGNTPYAPIIRTCAEVSYDSCSDVTEPYEAILVQLNNVTVDSAYTYGAVWVSDGTGACIVDDDMFLGGVNPPTITVGETYSYIRGICRYTYGQYKVMPRFADDVLQIAYTPIYALQHTDNVGTFPNCYPTDSIGTVQTINGTVMGVYANNVRRCFVQDAADPWSGVYLYNIPSGDTAVVGDNVIVTGTITEYNGETELGTISSYTIESSGNTPYAPIIRTCAEISYDTCSDVTEPYEGMLVQLNNVTVDSAYTYGAVWVSDGTGACIVDDDMFIGGTNPPTITVGETYSYIRGICRYTYSQYKVMPRFADDVNSVALECTGSNIFTIKFSTDPGVDPDCWPSPYNGQTVTVCGMVTAVRQATYYNFYMQDQGNTAWGGIYVYDYTLPSGDTIRPNVGDYIQLTGDVNEYNGWTELANVTDYIVLGTNQDLPDTSVVTVAMFTPGDCDYTAEPFENELVRFNNLTVRSSAGYGAYWVTDSSTGDSIRIDDDLWVGGTDVPDPLPSTGASYDYIVGVLRWEGRNTGTYIRGWILLPRFSSDYLQAVIPEPGLTGVWPIDNNALAVTFDRVVESTSAENPANYSTFNGLSILSASLDSTGRKVVLATGDQPNNTVDTLIAANICDDAGHCMLTPKHMLFHSGLTDISYIQTPNVGGDSSIWIDHIFTAKGVITSDSLTGHYSNYFMRDESGPPYRGIHLYIGGVSPRPFLGDTVIVTGRCIEYYQETELSDLSVYKNCQILSQAGPDPEPGQATTADLMAHGEYYESDLVTVCDSFVVANTAFDSYGWLIRSLSNPAESLIVNKDGAWTKYTYVPVLDDTIRGITGIYRFSRNLFRISPRLDDDFNSFDTWCGGAGPGCEYVVGDANGNGTFNGLDVTYSVAYFKGGPPPPYECECPEGSGNIWYVAGDVNGSCSYNGLDVTYMVAYFKGGPGPRPCPDCPPIIFMKAPVGVSPIQAQPSSGSLNGQ